MADNERAGGGEKRVDVALTTLLHVYYQALRAEPLPGRLVETVRELAASTRAESPPPDQPRVTLQ